MTYAELSHFTRNACAHCAARDEHLRLARIHLQSFVAIERRMGDNKLPNSLLTC